MIRTYQLFSFPITTFAFACTLFVNAYALTPSNYITEVQKKADVLNYYLKVDLDYENKNLIGEITITAIPKAENINEFELNFYDNLIINAIKLNGFDTEFIRKQNRIIINSSTAFRDTFIVTVKYEGTPKRAGFDGFVFGEVNGKPLIYNISEPDFAPTWFPCDDDPADKALLDIEITNDSQFVSVSNGNLISTKSEGKKKIYHWKTVYPISTYLVAVYSSAYINYSDSYTSLDGKDSMKIEYYVLPEHLDDAKIDFAEHKDMLKIFSELFGEYPFIKEKYGVAEFLWNYGAMENQTITGIGYNFLSGKNFFRDTYSHELSHHWWGNSVGLKSWKDIWLNEGFASYSEALYLEKKFGRDAHNALMSSKFNDSFRGTLYNPKNLFGETVYDKGAWVLFMLRNEVGDSTFIKILKDYYDEYKYSNASTSDFKNVCEKISGKNLNNFFDQWIYTGDENINCVYSFNVEEEAGIDICKLKIEQIQEKYPEFNFPLEIKIEYQDGSSELKQVQVISRQQEFLFNVNKNFKDIYLDTGNKLLAVFKKIPYKQ